MKRCLKLMTTVGILAGTASQAADFEQWREGFFTPAELAVSEVSASFADPDQDGRVNLLEYSMGTDPKSFDSDSGVTVSRDTTGKLVLEYRQPLDLPDVLLIPQITNHIGAGWTTGPSRMELISSSVTNPGFLTRILRDTQDPAATPRRFVRLMADFDRDLDGLPDLWELHNGLSSRDYSDWDSDFDGDGRTAFQEFQDGTDPLTHDQPPEVADIPSAPKNVVITTLEDGSRLVQWVDTSDNESFFQVVETLPDGTVFELARVGPSQTSVVIPAAR